jgi:hypothetical protein
LVSNAASSVSSAYRPAQDPTMMLVTIAQRAFRSDDVTEQIPGPARPPARRQWCTIWAVGQHRFDTKHVMPW